MSPNSQANHVFGVGIFSFADAARFIGAKPQELRRWSLGYEFTSRRGITVSSEPLWRNQLQSHGIEGIGFKDLIELRFVHAFRREGVSLQVIRRTLEVARERLSAPYPFTCKKFRTDGKRIFLEVIEETGDESLVDVERQQNVIRKVIGPSLRDGVELDMQGEAARWFPMKSNRSVVIDPDRKFGQPILHGYDIPTVTLLDAVKAERGNVKRVAKLFGVPAATVQKAVEFEHMVAAA